jgi:DNA adenine methylase
MLKPIFMWAGGKNKMIGKYLEGGVFPSESSFDTFVEPFFGGGAMTLYIHSRYPKVDNFVINDVNAEIMQLYTVVKTDLPSFLQVLNDLENKYLQSADRKVFFYTQRKIYTEVFFSLSKTEESALLFFLMRTAFNGLWQTTKAAKGRFATPAGLLNHKTHIYENDNLKAWSKFLNEKNVVITSGNWQDAAQSDSKGRTFFFFDPPYRDSFTQYGTVFDDAAHIELLTFANKQAKFNNSVFVCNRRGNDSFFEDNKGILNLNYFDVTYTAGRRSTSSDGKKEAKKAEEVLVWRSA